MLRSTFTKTLATGSFLMAMVTLALGGDHHKAVPVPPALEIEVLDPAADPVGNPAVETRLGPDGRMTIEIPKLVLVHRYYYTGDRSFQFRLIPGGPVVLVVDHPRTGERLYVETTLPPGAPRVNYTSESIQYDYGNQSVTLLFPKHGSPKVAFRHSSEKSSVERRVDRELKLATTNAEPKRKFGESLRKAATSTSKGVHSLSTVVTKPIAAAIKATPLGNLRSTPERDATKARNTLADKAAKEASTVNATIPSEL